MSNYKLGVLYGDGIGPEIVRSTVEVLQAVIDKVDNGVNFDFVELPMGWGAIHEYGDPVPRVTKDALLETDGWLMGPHDSAAYPDEQRIAKRNPSGEMRYHFDLYSNVRPSRSLPGCESLVGEADIVIFRENTEGFLSDRNMYKGIGEFMVDENTSISVAVFTRKAIERIAHEAFKLASKRRKKLSIVHKANVIKYSFGMFKDICYEIGAEYYPEVEVNDFHIDAVTAHLVKNMQSFDVLVTENLFGDIISDLAGELVGSLGLAASINTNGHQVMAQAAHGSAPDIAGQDIANPTSMLLSAVMMLEWMEAHHQDERLAALKETMEKAILKTLENGMTTPDLGGNIGTIEFTQAVIDNIEN